MKKLIFLVFLMLPACIIQPNYWGDECYELYGNYPDDCWQEHRYIECCEWSTSRHCKEIWCSDTDRYGYSECSWNYEEEYCF